MRCKPTERRGFSNRARCNGLRSGTIVGECRWTSMLTRNTTQMQFEGSNLGRRYYGQAIEIRHGQERLGDTARFRPHQTQRRQRWRSAPLFPSRFSSLFIGSLMYLIRGGVSQVWGISDDHRPMRFANGRWTRLPGSVKEIAVQVRLREFEIATRNCRCRINTACGRRTFSAVCTSGTAITGRNSVIRLSSFRLFRRTVTLP